MHNIRQNPEAMMPGVDPKPELFFETLEGDSGINICHYNAMAIISPSSNLPYRMALQAGRKHQIPEPCTLLYHIINDYGSSPVAEQTAKSSPAALDRLRDVLSPARAAGGLVIISGRASAGKSAFARALVNDATQFLSTGSYVYDNKLLDGLKVGAAHEAISLPSIGYVLLGVLSQPDQMALAIELATRGLKVVVEICAPSGDDVVESFWGALDHCESLPEQARSLVRDQNLIFAHLIRKPNA